MKGLFSSAWKKYFDYIVEKTQTANEFLKILYQVDALQGVQGSRCLSHFASEIVIQNNETRLEGSARIRIRKFDQKVHDDGRAWLLKQYLYVVHCV